MKTISVYSLVNTKTKVGAKRKRSIMLLAGKAAFSEVSPEKWEPSYMTGGCNFILSGEYISTISESFVMDARK